MRLLDGRGLAVSLHSISQQCLLLMTMIGRLNNPLTGWVEKIEWLGGIETRTPMEYNKYNWKTGKEFKPLKALEHTYETIHPSVRLRMGTPGKDINDKGNYNPESLDGWKVIGAAETPSIGSVDLGHIQKGQESIHWQKGDKKLPEAILSEIEYDLLKSFSPSIEGKFLSVVPT
jgi:hypothetical protein